MTNPHNPFARCYPLRVLEECLRFCERRGLHYVSDEVYALSRVGRAPPPDGVEKSGTTSIHTAPAFMSILSISADMAERDAVSPAAAGPVTRSIDLDPELHDSLQEPRKKRRVSSPYNTTARSSEPRHNGRAPSMASTAEDGTPTGPERTSGQRLGKRPRSPDGDDDGNPQGHAANVNVHVIWSLSKDFGSSGIKLVSPHRPAALHPPRTFTGKAVHECH